MKKIILIFALLLSIRPAGASTGGIVVVGRFHGTASLEELRDIYFQNGGRVGGKAVVPVDYKAGNPLRDQFYEKAFSRNRTQLKAYWAQRIFTGKGNPPLEVESVKAATSLILEKGEDYIGYMNEADVPASLNVLLRLEK